jgi:NAD(P)-dependent dehydrogenase (short-subunit alcohol dehydrogenase family)
LATTSMNGKTILITGATDGIGKETALALAEMGARIIVVGRNPEKCARITDQINRQDGQGKAEYLVADLSSQAQIRRLAAEFKDRYARLDVLVNNAGAYILRHQLTVDGIELTFALNHLNYFLLTNLLLDVIQASAPARIVNVSSAAHLGGKLDFANLQGGRVYNSWEAYSNSKLANVYFTYELARRLDGSRVTANALHPGFVASNFGKNGSGLLRPFFSISHLFAISPEKGAETPVYLASSPEVEGITGKYFVQKKAVNSSAISYDQDAARRLWQMSLEMTSTQSQS